jgi:PPOX class probable F420-dependent enzyme
VALQIDRSTPFGARVHDRLRHDRLAWLTTVGSDGTPRPAPVWFLWDAGTILVYSKPSSLKLKHLERNPRVALNLDGDGRGGDIVVITGSAAVDPAAPPSDQLAAYVEKYHAGILRNGMTHETFAHTYSVPIRITPDRLTGH